VTTKSPNNYTRTQAIIFVALSPILTLAAFIACIGAEVWSLVTEEIPAFFREDVLPELQWAVIEPLVALSISARLAREAYATRVRNAYTSLRIDLGWAYDEASAFFKKDGISPSGFWLRRAIKDTGRSGLRLAKTVVGL
jgi:hypothetical protein